MKPFTWEKSHIGNWKRLYTNESLSAIEEQLTEFEEQHFNKQIHNKYWTGGSRAIIIIIIIIIIMIYFGKNSILKCFKNSKRTPKEEGAPRELQYSQPANIREIRVQTESTKTDTSHDISGWRQTDKSPTPAKTLFSALYPVKIIKIG